MWSFCLLGLYSDCWVLTFACFNRRKFVDCTDCTIILTIPDILAIIARYLLRVPVQMGNEVQ